MELFFVLRSTGCFAQYDVSPCMNMMFIYTHSLHNLILHSAGSGGPSRSPQPHRSQPARRQHCDGRLLQRRRRWHWQHRRQGGQGGRNGDDGHQGRSDRCRKGQWGRFRSSTSLKVSALVIVFEELSSFSRTTHKRLLLYQSRCIVQGWLRKALLSFNECQIVRRVSWRNYTFINCFFW